ncbi:hypothetical protein RUND412_007855 [Rhizina undulata]
MGEVDKLPEKPNAAHPSNNPSAIFKEPAEPPEREFSELEAQLTLPGLIDEEHGNNNEVDVEEIPDDAYPEGGLRAWLVVIGSWLVLTSSFGIMNTMGTFQAYIALDQLKDYTQGEIGWIFSVYVFLSFFLAIQIGPLFDILGPTWLLLSGSTIYVAMFMILSICKEYYAFMLTFGILGGLGTCLLFTPAISVIGHWFRVRRGLATGFGTTGGGFGGIIFPLAINYLIPQIGFAWTVRVVGFICMILLVGGTGLIRRNPRIPPKKGANALMDLTAFKDMRFTLTTAGIFMLEWGLFVPTTYLTSYSIANGMSRTLANEVVAILNAASILGRWLPGIVADRVGRFNTIVITTILSTVVTFGVWLVADSHPPIVIVYAALFGFASGTGISLTPVCIGQVSTIQEYGKRYGTCYFFVSFGALTGIPVAGEIIARQGGSYQGLIIFTGSVYVGACICFIAARIVGGGAKFKTVY